MALLTISTASVRRLVGLDVGDTSQDTAIAAAITAEQLVHEYALDPGILALAVAAGAGDGLLATLTLGVGEVLAGDYLQTPARQGTLSGLKIAGITLGFPPLQTPGQLGSALTKQGLARLAPFTRAARSRTGAAAGPTPDDWAPIPQLIASQLLGSPAPPSSVFDGAFADIGDRAWKDGDGLVPALWETP